MKFELTLPRTKGRNSIMRLNCNKTGEFMTPDQKEYLNPKSISYVPTFEEMGLPQRLIKSMEMNFEDPIQSAKDEKEFTMYKENWQRKHRERLKRAEMLKKEKAEFKLSAHWFNRLSEAELIQLIDDSRRFADQVFDDLRGRIASEWELQYIEKLRLRVKKSPIYIIKATPSKLKRFPNYDFANNGLHGSVYTFYKLWSHIFKAKRESRGMIDTSK